MKWQHEHLLLGMTALVTLGLGAIGFHEANSGFTWPTAILSALQLFTLSSGVVDGPVPKTLEAARWMAAALSLTAVYRIAREVAADSILRARLFVERLMPTWAPLNRRCVVVGLGRKGISLITDLTVHRESGLRVLGIDRDPERVAVARSLGVDALVADGTSEDTLRLLPWRRCSWVTLLMSGDEPNVTAALKITRLREGADTKVAVHVPTLRLRTLLARQDALKARELRLFNFYERLARRVLLRYPVEVRSIPHQSCSPSDLVLGLQDVEPALDRIPHVFIRPSRDFTPALVASLARSAHFPSGGCTADWTRIRVVLVGDDAVPQRESIRALHPALRRSGEFALIDFDVLVPESGQSAAEAIASRLTALLPETPVTVMLDIHEPGTALLEALAILDGLGITANDAREDFAGTVRCIFDFAEEPAIQTFLTAHPTFARYLYPFPSMADCCGGRVLFDAEDQLDTLARRIHAQYDREGQQPWDSLSLELQDSNRAAADHIGIVLRWLRSRGRDVRTEGFVWDTNELNILAECEHRRWAAQKLIAGWEPDASLGEAQDKVRKRHGCLDRHYAELSDTMRERDRANVRAIPELFALSRKFRN